MTRDEVVSTILRRVSRQPDNADLVSDVIRELNLAQTTRLELGTDKPWFLLNIVELRVDHSGYRAPLPLDFLEMFEDSPSMLAVGLDGGLRPLERTGRAGLEWSLSSPNAMSAYELNESYCLFGTKMPAGSAVRMLYYQREPLSIATYNASVQPSPNRWYKYAPDLLIAEAGRIIATFYSKDDKAAAGFATDLVLAKRRITADTVSKVEASRERFLNGSLFPIPDSPRIMTTTGNIADPSGMPPRNYDSIVPQGADWVRVLQYILDGIVVDLTNYSAEMHVKTSYGSPPLLILQSPIGGIALGGPDGTITLHMTAAQTSSLVAGLYAFDLELTDPTSKKARVLQGTLTVTAEVTT